MMDRDGRSQGLTPRIPAALAPTILRSLLLRASEGRKSIGPYLNGIDHKGSPLLCYADKLLGEGEIHLIERIHEKHVKSNRRKTYPRGRVSKAAFHYSIARSFSSANQRASSFE